MRIRYKRGEAVITGGREYEPSEAELDECLRVLRERGIERVVHGDCRGVDKTVGAFLARKGYPIVAMPAENFGAWPACGPKRNRAMLERRGVRLCIAFKGNRGTWNCIRTAKRLARDVWVIGEGRW